MCEEFVVSPFEPGPERGVGLAAGQARLRATAPDITWCVEGETQRTVGAPGDHQRQRDPELFGGGSHEFVGLPLGGDVENCVVPCPLGPGAIIGTQRFQPATAQVGIEVLGLFPSTVRARLKHCSEGCPNKSASCRSLKVSSGPSRANPIGESARSDVTMSESSAPVLRGGGMDVSTLNCSTPPEPCAGPTGRCGVCCLGRVAPGRSGSVHGSPSWKTRNRHAVGSFAALGSHGP